MNTYKVTLASDQGKFNLNVNASSEEQARKTIMNAEGCPSNAILEIQKI